MKSDTKIPSFATFDSKDVITEDDDDDDIDVVRQFLKDWDVCGGGTNL